MRIEAAVGRKVVGGHVAQVTLSHLRQTVNEKAAGETRRSRGLAMCVSKPCALSFSGSKVNLSGRKFEHVGAWSPVMWTGNRPERNERLRAAASSPVTPRALTPHPTPPLRRCAHLVGLQ